MTRLFVTDQPLTARALCGREFRRYPHVYWVEHSTTSPRSWPLFRHSLPYFRDLLGNRKFLSILNTDPVLCDLILHRGRWASSSEQREELDQLKARLTSHLSHNWFLDRPVLHRVTALLAQLYAEVQPVLVFPNILDCEPSTLAILFTLYRRHPENAPDVVVGYPKDTIGVHQDHHGIFWGYEEDKAQQLLVTLEALPDMEIVRSTETLDDSEAPDPPSGLDPLDEDLDGTAYEALESDVDQESALAAGHRGAFRAFEMFSRHVCIRICQRILDRGIELAGERGAEIHALGGLCAHNWQFSSAEGSENFTKFLLDRFHSALRLTENPALKACLCYRLAVTLGRRRQELNKAFFYADGAIRTALEELQDETERLYQLIWAHNIRAYLHLRSGNVDDAFNDSRHSMSLMHRLVTQVAEPSHDLRFTRTVLADNNHTLCKLTGREGELHERTQENMKLLESDPEAYGGRFTTPYWIYHFRKRHELDSAIKAAELGLADAGVDYPKYRWYFLSQLGDLRLRVGAHGGREVLELREDQVEILERIRLDADFGHGRAARVLRRVLALLRGEDALRLSFALDRDRDDGLPEQVALSIRE